MLLTFFIESEVLLTVTLDDEVKAAATDRTRARIKTTLAIILKGIEQRYDYKLFFAS